MSLAPSTQFGVYEITAQLGVGGMGEVYRAIDTSLDRDVAIKVLPESFASDENRVARFELEAKTLAALNHPNIGQIYGIERHEGTTALVMELVEGPTLADRIAQGALAADEAIDIAMQIANALEAAHNRQIIHRDLKPANIKLRPDGIVKVLDFGIAKAIDPITATSGTPAPSLTTPAMTQAGVILGTAAYMSPEQARGRPIDQRADIWAFGCLLFEMLTGQPAFGGDDVTVTLARVLERDTDIESLPAGITPAVRQAIRLCLQKDPARRVHHIGDVRLMIAGAFDARGSAAVAQKKSHGLATAALLAVVGLAVGFVLSGFLADDPALPPQVVRTIIDVPVLPTGDQPQVKMSDDGRYLSIETGLPDDSFGLWVRPLNSTSGTFIGSAGQIRGGGAWAPDGRAMCYFMVEDGVSTLFVQSYPGGSITPIAGIVDPDGEANGRASWGSRDRILYQGGDGSIQSIAANGGDPVRVTRPADGESHRDPEFLPDGERFLYVAMPGKALRVRAGDGDERELGIAGVESPVRYSPSGHLLYVRDDVLWAQSFDADALTLEGEPRRIAENIVLGEFDISNDHLAYFSRDALKQLVWVDRSGAQIDVIGGPDIYHQIAISPDASRVAVNARRGIYVLNRVDGRRTELTPGDTEAFFTGDPIWVSNDTVAYSKFERGRANVYVQRVGSDPPANPLLEPGVGNRWVEGVQGRRLIWLETERAGGGMSVFALDLEAPDAAPQAILNDVDYAIDEPNISPDGRWLSYTANRSGGRSDVYLRRIDGAIDSDRFFQVSEGGGGQPRWNGNSAELVFLGADGVMYAVAVGDDIDRIGQPRALFETGILASAIVDQFAMTADGERFLLMRNVSPSQVTLVQNWVQELAAD